MIFAVEGFLGNMLLRALSPPCHPSRILQLPALPQVLQGAGMSPLTSRHPWHRPPLFPAEQRGAVEILKLTHLIALFPLIYLFSLFFPHHSAVGEVRETKLHPARLEMERGKFELSQ